MWFIVSVDCLGASSLFWDPVVQVLVMSLMIEVLVASGGCQDS